MQVTDINTTFSVGTDFLRVRKAFSSTLQTHPSMLHRHFLLFPSSTCSPRIMLLPVVAGDGAKT